MDFEVGDRVKIRKFNDIPDKSWIYNRYWFNANAGIKGTIVEVNFPDIYVKVQFDKELPFGSAGTEDYMSVKMIEKIEDSLSQHLFEL